LGIPRGLPPLLFPEVAPLKGRVTMSYKNPKELLVAATALPAAIEAMLPAGAPKLSVTLADAAGKLPVAPDFPVEIPDLPAVPAFPEMPTPPGGGELRPPIVTGVEVKPIREAAAEGILGGGYRPLYVKPQAEVATGGGGYRPLNFEGEVRWQKRDRESKQF